MTKIAITGTPATGKTTVARLAGKRLGWLVIDLNKFAEERNLYSGYDEGREVKIADMGKIQKSLNNIEARDMIIESHYAHEMKSDAVIVLRANPDELRKRGKEKGWNNKKTEENVLSEIMEVCKQEAMEGGRTVFEVDTTGKDPDKVVSEVIGIIERFKKLGFKEK
jgi:adenylate kinase